MRRPPRSQNTSLSTARSPSWRDPIADEILTDYESLINGLEDEHRRDLLRIGVAGQLYLDGKLKRILPADDNEAYSAANPIAEDGTVTLDSELIEAREDAIVRRRLKSEGVKVLILGGAYDLTDNLLRLGDVSVELVTVASDGWARFGE